MPSTILPTLIVCLSVVGCRPSVESEDKGTTNPLSGTTDVGLKPAPNVSADSEKIRERVKKIVADQFGVKAGDLDMNKPLEKYGDELDVVEAVMTIEETYSIMIPDERIMDKKAKGSVGIHKDLSTTKLVEIVTELINSKQSPKTK